MEGVKRVVFKRDARIHDKHHYIPIFELAKAPAARVETLSAND
jgi:hypothetical protein